MTGRREGVEFIKERLSVDPTDEPLEQIGSSVVDQIEDSFPEPLDGLRENKLEVEEG